MSRRRRGWFERAAVLFLAALVAAWLISRVSFWAGAVLGVLLLPVAVVLGIWSYWHDLSEPCRKRREK